MNLSPAQAKYKSFSLVTQLPILMVNQALPSSEHAEPLTTGMHSPKDFQKATIYK